MRKIHPNAAQVNRICMWPWKKKAFYALCGSVLIYVTIKKKWIQIVCRLLWGASNVLLLSPCAKYPVKLHPHQQHSSVLLSKRMVCVSNHFKRANWRNHTCSIAYLCFYFRLPWHVLISFQYFFFLFLLHLLCGKSVLQKPPKCRKVNEREIRSFVYS